MSTTQTKTERLTEIKAAKKISKESTWEEKNKLAKKLKGTRKTGTISKMNPSTKEISILELKPNSLILQASSIKYNKNK